MTFHSGFIKITAILLVQIGFIGNLLSDGRSVFEEAYRIEKSEPVESAKLYKKAISYGLPAELSKAAKWRLYFLCKDQQWYFDAYQALKSVAHKKSIEDSLMADIKSYWGLNKETFLSYAKSAAILEKSKTASDSEISTLRSAYSQGTNQFRNDLDRWLKDNGFESLSIQLASTDQNMSNVEAIIRTASYHVDKNDATSAKKALQPLLESTKLTQDEKYRVMYLLGRIERSGLGNDTVPRFLMAANYGIGKEKNRQIALAAFSLYRDGFTEQAAELTVKIPVESIEDPGMKLFLDVVAADVNNDDRAIARLKSKENQLRKEKNSFLAQRALLVLERRR
ncbi:MAG: hypothetical protein H3C43_11495 [Leptonema sp. (in: Bacteria)]|nr:hypothetical protein [Leptonema sp. (in: bacteria)]